MIAVENLHKHFGGFHAVDGATLTIARGSITGLIGRLGARDPRVTSFMLADPRGAQRRAMAAALADARTRASNASFSAGYSFMYLCVASRSLR